ncbi:hypothetical protein H4R34_002827 [Dimargaris verticillata]|uniref:(d)CMP kinase n=1 Tax=Dimargaris verticillata TaxID=2761393 RepID=A0A9W8ED77_9FUNG|nr:hypothetical protein H4R34_002827 [Dimargaris verticillata]
MLPAAIAPLARSRPCCGFLATSRRTLIVAIDGPAASGKSTTAKRVAYNLRFDYADSGLYNLLVPLGGLVLIRKGLLGWDFSDYSEHVALVAKNPQVRQVVLQWQRQYAQPTNGDDGTHRNASAGKSRNLVVDGRDIGTVVFPNAELKVYLIAQAEIRAQRRHAELVALSALKGRSAPSYREVLDDLMARDQSDLHRVHSPLKRASDAVDLDTTKLTIDDQVAQIVQWARQRGA